MEVRKLTFKISSEGFTKLNDSLKSSSASMGELGKKMKDIGGKLTKSVTLPLVGIGTAGVKMSVDVDTGLRKVMTLADKSVLPFKSLQSQIKDMSNDVGIMQTELLDATYEALSSGVETEDVLKFVRSGVDLTRAGFTDMTTAIDATTTVMNAYGDRAYEVTKIHDIFVQTQDKGKITVDELGKSIGRVIPTASSLGVNLDQLGASYAILTAEGQNARIATTNLNALLAELGTTGSQTDKTLRSKTGMSFAQLTESGVNLGEVLEMVNDSAKAAGLTLSDSFGSSSAGQAANVLLGLGQNADKFTQSLISMNEEAEGKTRENAKEMEGDAYKIEKAWVNMKNAMMDAGAELAPMVVELAEFAGSLANKFSAMDEGSQRAAVGLGVFAAALGPVIGLTGTLVTLLGAAGGWIGLIIAAVVALAIAIALNWDKIKESTGKAWDWLKRRTKESWNYLKDSVTGAIDGIKEKWQALKEFLKHPIKGTIDIFERRKAKKQETNKALGYDGSHKTGLPNVPYDGYIAQLHKNEEVLTANDPRNRRNAGTSNTGGASYNPTFNITMQGGSVDDERRIRRMIEELSKRERDIFFQKVALSRGV